MATLKATVKSKRKDGMYVVYIRFAHNRKISGSSDISSDRLKKIL